MAERKIWERYDHESGKAYAAFEVYLALGTARSLDAVAQKLAKSLPLLKRWSAQWQWVERARAYDNHMAAVAQAEREAEVKKIIESGYAQMHTRIKELDEVARMLRERIDDPGQHYLDGKFGPVFNKELFSEWRDTLNDIAKELGHRRQGLEISGKDGKPIEIIDAAAQSLDRKLALLAERLGQTSVSE